jgi:hypothetical protein
MSSSASARRFLDGCPLLSVTVWERSRLVRSFLITAFRAYYAFSSDIKIVREQKDAPFLDEVAHEALRASAPPLVYPQVAQA